MVSANSLANLQKYKFPKGHKPPRSPGRPRKKAWIEELDELASSRKEFKPLLLRALHKHPVDVLYYLMGKPKEMIVLDHTMKAEITTQERIDKAKAILEEMEKQSLLRQSEPKKTL